MSAPAEMVRLHVHAARAPDRPPYSYGTVLVTVHDAAGELQRTEVRGRELEVLEINLAVELDDGRRIASERCEQWLSARRSWSPPTLRRPHASAGGSRNPDGR